MAQIDVFVPCYRYAQYLRQSVESVLSQTDVDLRVLIIDDHSPDDTPEVAEALARSDPRVTWRRHAVNLGHIASYNEGIAWAESRYFLLLSADDYLLPGSLARAVSVMDEHVSVGLCYGGALELECDGTTTPAETGFELRCTGSARVVSGVEFIDRVIRSGTRNIVPTPTAVVRTSLLKRAGGYRPELPHSGDLELWLRLAAHGSVAIVDAQQAVYRRHANNMSRAYFADGRLADLLQRRSAIEAFLAACGAQMTDRADWQRRLAMPLAREAAGCASSALSDNRPELAAELATLALDLSPRVRWSGPWARLSAKRLLGRSLVRALRPAIRWRGKSSVVE